MGSCMGRCACRVQKCFCCTGNCIIFWTNLKDSITRRQRHTMSGQTFAMRRHSSSNTIEFENLMFEFNLPELSASVIPIQTTSLIKIQRNCETPSLNDCQNNTESRDHKTWLLTEDHYKPNNLIVDKSMSLNFANPLTFDNTMDERSCELPLIDALITQTTHLKSKSDLSDMREKSSLGGSSSLGELQWENEILSDDFIINGQNDTDLEWDHFQEDCYALQNQTQQLIHEIELLTNPSFNNLP